LTFALDLPRGGLCRCHSAAAGTTARLSGRIDQVGHSYADQGNAASPKEQKTKSLLGQILQNAEAVRQNTDMKQTLGKAICRSIFFTIFICYYTLL
jgi:hypothetical protein